MLYNPKYAILEVLLVLDGRVLRHSIQLAPCPWHAKYKPFIPIRNNTSQLLESYLDSWTLICIAIVANDLRSSMCAMDADEDESGWGGARET